MNEIELLVRPTPNCDVGLPDFDRFVADAARQGFLGVANANLLLASEGGNLSPETMDILQQVGEQNYGFNAGPHAPYDELPEEIVKALAEIDKEHFDFDIMPQMHNYVAPLVRTSDSLEQHDVYCFNADAYSGIWTDSKVFSVEYDAHVMSYGTVSFPKEVVYEGEDPFEYLQLEWPALVPDGLDDDLVRYRYDTDAKAQLAKNIGRVFFQLSYFDPRGESPHFQAAIEDSLAHYLIYP